MLQSSLCIALLCLALFTAGAPAQTVHIAQGTLAGSTASGISSFKGIPYAAPPVGDLRWRAPAAATPWTGTRPAREFGSACMQNLRRDTLPWTHEFMVQNGASEDCLFLNVWTPRIGPRAKLPVLLFIHGGGFNEGSGGIDVYDGTNLAKMGVVVVTINYRLGAFGFLAHPELTAESPEHSSGNYGLQDCLAALRWVRGNIGAFGGDPARVTIWGQSAGAFAVGALVASPVARAWFTGAIADSGLSHTGSGNPSLAEAERGGTAYAASRGAASLKGLRAMSAADLMKAPPPQGVRFRPVVDGWFLTRPATEAIEQKEGSDVPLLTGYQAQDARSLSRPPTTLQAYTNQLRSIYGASADEVLKLYPVTEDKDIAGVSESMSQDRNRVSQWIMANRRGATHQSATYTYYMDHAIPWPQHPEFGAFHTGELPYAFANLEKLDRPWTGEDREVSRVLSGYIVNFAKTGSPNGTGLPTWARAALPKQTMELGERFAPMPLANPQHEAFWERFLTSSDSVRTPIF